MVSSSTCTGMPVHWRVLHFWHSLIDVFASLKSRTNAIWFSDCWAVCCICKLNLCWKKVAKCLYKRAEPCFKSSNTLLACISVVWVHINTIKKKPQEIKKIGNHQDLNLGPLQKIHATNQLLYSGDDLEFSKVVYKTRDIELSILSTFDTYPQLIRSRRHLHEFSAIFGQTITSKCTLVRQYVCTSQMCSTDRFYTFKP